MPDTDQVRDRADVFKDKVKTAVGGALGDETLKAEGQGGQAMDRLQAAYDQRRGEVNARISQVESFAKAQPWAALGIAAVSGLVVGRLTARRKVVYVSRVKPSEVK